MEDKEFPCYYPYSQLPLDSWDFSDFFYHVQVLAEFRSDYEGKLVETLSIKFSGRLMKIFISYTYI